MADIKITPGAYPQTDNSYYTGTRLDEFGRPKPQFIASNEAGNGFSTYYADNVPHHLQPKESSFFGSIVDSVSGLISDAGSGITNLFWSWDKKSKNSEVPDLTFADCPKPSVFDGWMDSLGMFSDWLLGAGEADRVFMQCTDQVQNLSDSRGVNLARDYLYEKNAGKEYENWEPVTEWGYGFGLQGLVRAGIDPTEQFVGSYNVDIFPQENKKLRFEVTNNTSMESFLYGLGPDYERSELSSGGNMRQKYTWEEPLK